METTGSCKKCGAESVEMSKDGKTCKVCMAARFAKKEEDSPRPKAGESRASERKKRVPMNTRDVLTYNHMDPNFVYYNPVDRPGRIERLEQAGWEVVVDGEAEACTPNTVRGKLPGKACIMPAGNGENHVLMRKPKDWYDEDMGEIQARATELEKDIYRSKEKSDFYEPNGYKTKIASNMVRSIEEN